MNRPLVDLMRGRELCFGSKFETKRHFAFSLCWLPELLQNIELVPRKFLRIILLRMHRMQAFELAVTCVLSETSPVA